MVKAVVALSAPISASASRNAARSRQLAQQGGMPVGSRHLNSGGCQKPPRLTNTPAVGCPIAGPQLALITCAPPSAVARPARRPGTRWRCRRRWPESSTVRSSPLSAIALCPNSVAVLHHRRVRGIDHGAQLSRGGSPALPPSSRRVSTGGPPTTARTAGAARTGTGCLPASRSRATERPARCWRPPRSRRANRPALPCAGLSACPRIHRRCWSLCEYRFTGRRRVMPRTLAAGELGLDSSGPTLARNASSLPRSELAAPSPRRPGWESPWSCHRRRQIRRRCVAMRSPAWMGWLAASRVPPRLDAAGLWIRQPRAGTSIAEGNRLLRRRQGDGTSARNNRRQAAGFRLPSPAARQPETAIAAAWRRRHEQAPVCGGRKARRSRG